MSDPQILPIIGTTGLYNLKAPFETALMANTPYTCIAVRRLSDIVAAGGEPQVEYYQPYNLSDDAYQADLANDVCIISLQAAGSETVYVPSSYLASYPDIGGVPYTVLALAINIGALPDALDLTYLKTKLNADIVEVLGVDTTINVAAISRPSLMPYDMHNSLEAARQAKITAVKTDYAKYLEAQTALDQARTRIAELEAYILANQPATPTA